MHQHGQMHLGHGLVSGAGAVQKQTLQVTFPAGGLHKPLSNDKDESAPRLEDTTTSWAPDEFVFSPQVLAICSLSTSTPKHVHGLIPSHVHVDLMLLS